MRAGVARTAARATVARACTRARLSPPVSAERSAAETVAEVARTVRHLRMPTGARDERRVQRHRFALANFFANVDNLCVERARRGSGERGRSE